MWKTSNGKGKTLRRRFPPLSGTVKGHSICKRNRIKGMGAYCERAENNISSRGSIMPTRLGKDEITKVQLERLNLVLAREMERGGFYRNLPEHVDSLDELHNLPFTTEDDLRRHGGGMLLVSQSNIEKIISGETSGTTGEGKRVFYTAGDCENTVLLFMDGISEMVSEGEKVLVCMPYSGKNSLGALISEAVRRLGAVPVEAGCGLTYSSAIKLIKEEEPASYIGFPQPILAVLRLGGRMSLRRALISGDSCPASVLEGIERILNPGNSNPADIQLSVFPHYGSREMCLGGAVTCSAHRGMHLREGHVIAEIIDRDGNILPDGEWGELVITTIGMEAQPLIRYKTGDRTRIIPGVCSCGRETLRLDNVTRLAGDMSELDNRMFKNPELIDYRAYYLPGDSKNEEPRIEVLLREDVSAADRPFYPAKRHIVCSMAAIKTLPYNAAE